MMRVRMRASKTTLVRAGALLPRRLRSNRQLAREAILRGAIQKPSEFADLLGIVRRIKPKVIVEIGSARGGATHAFRVAAPSATVVSIDIAWPATIQSDSHSPETVQALRIALGVQPIDLLFIDGDHSYTGARSDFEMYAPLVRVGGVIALHDILPHPSYPGFEVHRYWKELAATHECRELVDLTADWGWGQWGGIGVITLR